MKRVVLTSEDLLRVRIGAPLGALGETLLASRMLRRARPAIFDGWRSTVLREIPCDFGMLADLVPNIYDFVDLITPTRGARSLPEGLEALRLVSREELRREIGCTVRRLAESGDRPLPGWTAKLPDADGTALRELATAVEAFHDVAFGGRWAHVQSYLESAADRMARVMATEGVYGLFAALRPHVRWRTPVLEVMRLRGRHDVRLNGRGLVVVPSIFVWPEPLLLSSCIETGGPYTLIVPVLRDIGDLATAWGPRPPNEALTALLGRTRAAALQAIADGCTTTQLAGQLAISPATASEHASILRDAGLIESTRHRNSVRHQLTTLGAALLDGDLETGVRIA
ncbi:ArsR/SmtB family transcription factor [Nocardia arthritidis]|uniref:Helix-turn-helix domain-containing protein n=1 Tax=Nocardia arthritidis TaxID=228602 RepID=A0A6G9YC91_9NOCA|nr:winged helix-turn-helix domain-containing protein [Nocardia arthritidis]QIS10849.1 helix-turn-helix domain-containing protein [Nocardia arthritidis]